MTTSKAQTRAVDIDCPIGHAYAGYPCADGTYCQERIKAAMAKTRGENLARKNSASK